MKRNLQAASSAALSAQNGALEKAKEARKCREELEDAEEQLEVVQIAANNARDDAKTARWKRPSLKLSILLKWIVSDMRLVN